MSIKIDDETRRFLAEKKPEIDVDKAIGNLKDAFFRLGFTDQNASIVISLKDAKKTDQKEDQVQIRVQFKGLNTERAYSFFSVMGGSALHLFSADDLSGNDRTYVLGTQILDRLQKIDPVEVIKDFSKRPGGLRFR